MQLLSKEDLIEAIKSIAAQGWHPSTKITTTKRNDGAVGNTLESLLGISENNLPIPNANEWELKGQRLHSGSLITLKHSEPSPRAAKIVSNILLPLYGWTHKKAGTRYPSSEMSFRSTTSATDFTNRGFKVIVDREQEKVRFTFDATKADSNNGQISEWLESVESRIGLGSLNPEPFWGFEDLKYALGAKISNCFYVIADSKVVEGHEYFSYEHLLMLSGFSFEGLLNCIESGSVLVDFDARTGHNHGTKFRLKQNVWSLLYENVVEVF